MTGLIQKSKIIFNLKHSKNTFNNLKNKIHLLKRKIDHKKNFSFQNQKLFLMYKMK
jgi:hypothetical protein